MGLSVGILMTGALYWDEGRRKEWREARLVAGTEAAVAVPIRYGRRASTGAYSMVFSRGCPVGSARVMECRNPVEGWDELVVEAESLWTAERLSDRTNHQISAAWGCVALMVNPLAAVPKGVLSGWARRVKQAPGYGRVPQVAGEGTLVSGEGLLQIAWPESGLDLMLTTVTHPTLEGGYATPAMIAAGGLETVEKNRANGIVTFEDELILRP